ncbi:hypothetical protein GCM10027018_13280 [Paenibacillus thermoaerophilus]
MRRVYFARHWPYNKKSFDSNARPQDGRNFRAQTAEMIPPRENFAAETHKGRLQFSDDEL